MACPVHNEYDEGSNGHHDGHSPRDDHGAEQSCDRVYYRACHRGGDRGYGDDR
jgi:hypothetical protein